MSLLVDGGCGLCEKHTKVKIDGTTTHACYVDPLYGQNQTLSLIGRFSFFEQVSQRNMALATKG
jgi:hypothetical protein